MIKVLYEICNRSSTGFASSKDFTMENASMNMIAFYHLVVLIFQLFQKEDFSEEPVEFLNYQSEAQFLFTTILFNFKSIFSSNPKINQINKFHFGKDTSFKEMLDHRNNELSGAIQDLTLGSNSNSSKFNSNFSQSQSQTPMKSSSIGPWLKPQNNKNIKRK